MKESLNYALGTILIISFFSPLIAMQHAIEAPSPRNECIGGSLAGINHCNYDFALNPNNAALYAYLEINEKHTAITFADTSKGHDYYSHPTTSVALPNTCYNPTGEVVAFRSENQGNFSTSAAKLCLVNPEEETSCLVDCYNNQTCSWYPSTNLGKNLLGATRITSDYSLPLNGEIIVYEVDPTTVEVKQLAGISAQPYFGTAKVTWLPSEKQIAITQASIDEWFNKIATWDLTTQKPACNGWQTPEAHELIYSIVPNPNDTTAMLMYRYKFPSKTVFVDLKNHQTIAHIDENSAPLEWRGNYCVVRKFTTNQTKLWDIRTLKQALITIQHQTPVTNAAINHQETKLASIEDYRKLYVADIPSGTTIVQDTGTYSSLKVAWTADDSACVVEGGPSMLVSFYSPTIGTLIPTTSPHWQQDFC